MSFLRLTQGAMHKTMNYYILGFFFRKKKIIKTKTLKRMLSNFILLWLHQLSIILASMQQKLFQGFGKHSKQSPQLQRLAKN